jgi:hypothetical protein
MSQPMRQRPMRRRPMRPVYHYPPQSGSIATKIIIVIVVLLIIILVDYFYIMSFLPPQLAQVWPISTKVKMYYAYRTHSIKNAF